MRQIASSITIPLLLVGGLILAGCQDSLIGSSSENADVKAPSVAKSQSGTGNCDTVVSESIQGAVDNATSGDVICVEPGTYQEKISVGTSVTLRSLAPATEGNPAIIDGSVSLNADGSELRHFVITRSDDIAAPSIDAFGVRVKGSNTVVADNVVRGLTGKSQDWGAINGIQVFGESSISDIVLRGNTVTGFRNTLEDEGTVGGVAGIKLQADLRNVKVRDNSVSDLHSAGWAWGVVLAGSGSSPNFPKNVSVTQNDISELNDGSVSFPGDAPEFPGSSFGIDTGAKANEATVKYNNLLAPNGAESKDADSDLKAECNWWGDRSGPTHDGNSNGEGTEILERNGATIDYTPWLISPAPSKACNGGKLSGNSSGQDGP